MKGKELVGSVELFVVFSVAAFDFAIVSWRVGSDELVPDAQFLQGLLKKSLAAGSGGVQAVGKFRAVICLDAFNGVREFLYHMAEEIRENIQSYQDAAAIPLLIGVDEEGGTVVRMSSNPDLCEEPFWSPRKLYSTGGMRSVLYAEGNKLQLFSSLGINVNFAPVCDISTDPDDFIYDRSLGEGPVPTGEYVRQVVELYLENGKGSVLKHFPGYGNNPDTHTGAAVDRRGYDSFRSSNFIPFQAGIDAGAGCVLVSHNIVTCVDPDAPASLSKAWHDILRNELGFEGCIITDDLYMDAIRKYCGADRAAVMAVLAGNDLLCCTDYQSQYPAVLEAVRTGELSEERIDQSVLRILRWKRQLGLLDGE